jgi:hypothetical protein
MGTSEPLTHRPASWVHRAVTGGVRRPPPAGVAAPAPRRGPPWLTPRQYQVLQAVADGRIARGWLLGDLEPYLLEDRDVIGVLRRLVLRRLVLLAPIGPPSLTRRGRRVLDGPD